MMFNSRFIFKDDLTFRVSKARSMMGFIKRQACEFKDPSVLKSLYFAFVGSRLEYCSQVFNTYCSSYFEDMNGIRTLLNDIEGIQASFLRILSRDDQQALTMNYEQRCNHISTLKGWTIVD